MKELLGEVYGAGFDRNYRLRQIIEEIDNEDGDIIDFNDFRRFNQRFPSMLFPAYRMQRILRARVFGVCLE